MVITVLHGIAPHSPHGVLGLRRVVPHEIHDVFKSDVSLMVRIQSVKGEADVALIDPAVAEAGRDELVPVEPGLSLANPHGIKNILHLLLSEPTQRA